MTIRDATVDDLDEILALVRELAEYEREPGAVVVERDEFIQSSSVCMPSRRLAAYGRQPPD